MEGNRVNNEIEHSLKKTFSNSHNPALTPNDKQLSLRGMAKPVVSSQAKRMRKEKSGVKMTKEETGNLKKEFKKKVKELGSSTEQFKEVDQSTYKLLVDKILGL